MTSISPENNPDYKYDDRLKRLVRRPGTHSGAKKLQREALWTRKQAIDNGENIEQTTQNSFYYFLRTIFLKNGINPAYEGPDFRKTITNQIDDICHEWKTTREDLLIIADARATLYYNNQRQHVSLKNIEENYLYLRGTDVIIIEKAALCNLLAPLAAKAGIALIDTKGYVVEYAKKLSELALKYDAHVAMISDWDSDGLLMSLRVYDDVSKDIYRIGIDWETRDELIQMYPDLSGELELDKLQEEYKPGNSYKKLRSHAYWGKEERRIYYNNLQRLEKHRIEIDSVQRAVGYQKLWAYIIKKLGERFSERNYNRAINIPGTIYPDIYLQLGNLLAERMKPELDILKKDIRQSLEQFKGFLDNVRDDEKAIYEYLKDEINGSKNLVHISNKIKELVNELKQQNIQSFMESTF